MVYLIYSLVMLYLACTIKGKGGHAALPHNSADPVFAASQMIGSLQAIITRNKRPVDAAVLSITQFHAGDASNIIPDSAWIGGTVRTFTIEVLDLIEARLNQIASATAQAFDCSAEVIILPRSIMKKKPRLRLMS